VVSGKQNSINIAYEMKKLITFNKVYFLLTVVLFVIEVIIAKYVHDEFIRPYIGDLLVVMLVYCFVKSFLNTAVLQTALAVLLFSYSVEFLQYANIVKLLGLQNYKIARIVIGTSFSWIDMLLYTLGILLVIIAERKWQTKTPS
jgi:Protein of unknown function (DUF2809)